jgi:hypothetical protein
MCNHVLVGVYNKADDSGRIDNPYKTIRQHIESSSSSNIPQAFAPGEISNENRNATPFLCWREVKSAIDRYI